MTPNRIVFLFLVTKQPLIIVNTSCFLSFKVEDKLIVSVAAYPAMFDTSVFVKRKKKEAWRRFADVVGAPGGVFVL